MNGDLCEDSSSHLSGSSEKSILHEQVMSGDADRALEPFDFDGTNLDVSGDAISPQVQKKSSDSDVAHSDSNSDSIEDSAFETVDTATTGAVKDLSTAFNSFRIASKPNRSSSPSVDQSALSQTPLNIDCTKLSFAERQQLLVQLQILQSSNTGKRRQGYFTNSKKNFRGSPSEDSIVTPSSLSGESLAVGGQRSRKCPALRWVGDLPPRSYRHPVFSSKIFVGGIPWDITEEGLLDAFGVYGVCHVEWPGKEPRYSRAQVRNSPKRKVSGYVYIVFEHERSVKSLLQDCSQEFSSAGEWYFKLKACRNHTATTEIRQVQVIPWVISDSTFVEDPGCRIDPKKTVFVGALHGMITASVLFNIMEELYGNVVFVGIDTDKYKYPIGSGRVTFSSHSSYFRSIESAFLEIKTSKFTKKVQIDPFLEDSFCMTCYSAPGPYFCRDRTCFRYFCSGCWEAVHASHYEMRCHSPLMRDATRCRIPRDLEPHYQPSYHRSYGSEVAVGNSWNHHSADFQDRTHGSTRRFGAEWQSRQLGHVKYGPRNWY